MGNHKCEWVGARLPLWVDKGDSDGSPQAHDERGDLTAVECRQIEQHLASCARCRRHRFALEQAFCALEVAANQLPVIADAPSLWPVLAQRIADDGSVGHGQLPSDSRSLSSQLDRPWAKLNSVHPIRQAWTHDTLREILAEENRQTAKSRQFYNLLLQMSAAAAMMLLTLSGVWLANRQWTSAQFTILANQAPLPDPLPSPIVAEEPALEITERNRDDVPINQLADAEPSRPSETAPPAIDTPVPKPSMHTRFGFDLEHGIPMPPDTREAKPVY